MQKLSSISDRTAGRAALVAGAAALAGGVTEIVHSQRHSGNDVVGLAGYLTLSFFTVFLIAVAPSFIALARHARSRLALKAGVAAAAGTLVLGLTSIASLINGHDLGVFNVIAPPTNAAWLFGSIIIAVALKRAGTVSTALAIGLPIAWVATIPLATVGGGVIAGAYYLAIGYLLVNDAIERRPHPALEPTSA
jgi:hypothetical protein